MKVKKIAFIIAGDFRTWEHAAENIFAYADTQDAQVDFFFSVWDKTADSHWPANKWAEREVSSEMATAKFTQHNLVSYNLSPRPMDQMQTTFYYQCYLAKIGNILKRQQELVTGVPYDLVFETRPDIFLLGQGAETLDLVDFQFTNLEWMAGDLPQTNDFFTWANSFTNDLLSGKFATNPGTGIKLRDPMANYNHWLHYKYNNSLLLTCKGHGLSGSPIRANAINKEPLNLAMVIEYNNRWMDQLWT